MFSILIPTYNFDCSKLCQDLHKQALKIGEDFEILVYDDFSTKKYSQNKELSNLSNVIYKELPRNYGRAAIRNLMAKEAKGTHLLFLDCDGEIASKNYLCLYHKFKDEADVICGGRIYPEREKIKQKFYLHWIYGKKRESKCNRCNAKSFMTNNFLIRKDIFETSQFDSTMLGYGHEDTAFGVDLKKRGFKFKIISNPVIHIGLYDANEFVNNTRNSIRNLVDIIDKNNNMEDFFDIKLVKAYFQVNKYKLRNITIFSYKLLRNVIEVNLRSKHPNLHLLDFYKLGYFSQLSKEKQANKVRLI